VRETAANVGAVLALIAVSIVIAAGAIGIAAVSGSYFSDDSAPEHCYAIVDANGTTWPSDQPPYYGAYGFLFHTDPQWGYVTDPVALVYDRDCLRAKGVQVD